MARLTLSFVFHRGLGRRARGRYVRATNWSWKILLNGRLEEHLYAIGAVRPDLPLAELRARGHVNDRAPAADREPEFSRKIREGAPDRP